MTDSQIKHIIFLILSLFVFFIEICIFSYTTSHIFFLSTCLSIGLINTSSRQRYIIFPFFFASIISYLDTQIAGFALLYLIPNIMYVQFLHEHLYVKKIIPFLLLNMTIITQACLTSWLGYTTISGIKIAYLVWYNSWCLAIFNILLRKIDSYREEKT